MSRKNSASLVPDGRSSGGSLRAQSAEPPGSRAQLLEQEIDGYLRRREASESLEEDAKKRDLLIKKREQYISYRKRIAAKQKSEQRDLAERTRALEAQIQ